MQETEHLVLCKKLSLIFIVFISSSISFSQVYPNQVVDSLLKKGIYEIIKQNYDGAETVFDTLEEKFPQLPFGKIYLAAGKIAQAYDYGNPYDEKFILKNLKGAIDQSKSLVEKSNNNVWYIYSLALSQGYYAYYEALNKNWISALNEGINSISNFNKCLFLDSAFYDADVALGTFKYWKSKKTEILNFLPVFKNEESQGIELLKIAIKHSFYNKYLAMNSLIWIYIEQKKFSKAKYLAEDALNEFPESRLFMWVLARSYEEDSASKAIEIYFNILKSYNGKSIYNNILINHIIAQQYYKLGNYEKALELCNKILAITNIPKDLEVKLSKRIDRVKRLKQKLQEQLSR